MLKKINGKIELFLKESCQGQKLEIISKNIHKTQISEQYIFHAYFISCILNNKNKVSNLAYIVKM